MAVNPGQADQAADAAVVDDGFDSPEERAAFAEMEKDTPAEPDATPEPAPAEGGAPAPKVGEPPAPAAEADDEDEDGEGEAEPAAGTAPPADGSAPKPKKRVSARKYERTAAELAEAKAETAKLRENQARLDERMRILNEALTPKAPDAKAAEEVEEDAEPDAEKDIFAHNAWLKRQLTKLNDRMDQGAQEQRVYTEEQQIASTYMEDAQAVAAADPTFVPAYQFLMANRTYELAQYFFQKDLSEEGAQLTPQELARIKQTIGTEERQLATEAIKNGRSPAKAVLALAKARGYRPAAPAANPDGAAKPAAPGSLAAPAARVEDEIANIRRGSAASRSLSDAGGAPPAALTPEKLAAMSDDDFSALVENMTPAQEQALFGT